jgi:hypothetical protein
VSILGSTDVVADGARISVEFGPTEKRLAALAVIEPSVVTQLVEAIRDPDDFRPEVLRPFAEAAHVHLDELGQAVSLALAVAATDDMAKALASLKAELETAIAERGLTEEGAQTLLERVETIAKGVGGGYVRGRKIDQALRRTFPVLSHVHAAVSTIAAGATGFDAFAGNLADYSPDVGELVPVVVLQLDIDAYDDTKQVAVALRCEQLDRLVARLQAARLELKALAERLGPKAASNAKRGKCEATG